jgi:hypothetical protein
MYWTYEKAWKLWYGKNLLVKCMHLWAICSLLLLGKNIIYNFNSKGSLENFN